MAGLAHWPLLPGGPGDDASGPRRSSTFGALPGLITRDKPKIDITLADQQAGCFVPSYTTLDRIQGKATITCSVDTPFESIHVIFQGAGKTFVEKIASSAPTTPRTHAYHNFLRLVQPMDSVELPEDKVLRAGGTYVIPFTFVMPERLLPQACTHPAENPSVQDAHLTPPPSFGDPMMAGDGKSLMDDMAPPMSMISYGIRVIIARRDANKLRSVADAMKKLRIVPATEEQPPLSVQEGIDDYYLRRSKPLKKGMFKGKVGTLTATAEQPPPLRMPFIRGSDTEPCGTTTMAAVDLLFEPRSANAKPPRLGQLWVKIKCMTFFATVPLTDFPHRSQMFTYDPQRGLYVETVPLSTRRIESVQWIKHEGQPQRRDSGVSVPANVQKTPYSARPRRPSQSPRSPQLAASVSSPSSLERQRTDSAVSTADELPPPDPLGVHYTARVLVPIDLPTTSKAFVPTFHTCLMGRVYALDLAVSAHGGSKTVSGFGSTTTLHLKVPLQITQEGNPAASAAISPSETRSPQQRIEAMAASERRGSAMSVGANEQSSGMADQTLRGARGSVFMPPRWGSVAWGDGSAASQPARMNSTSSDGSDEEMVDEDNVGETRREMMEALEDDSHGVHRERNDEDPPSYTAFNGIASRGRGTNFWT